MQRRVEGKLMKERTSLQLCFATLRSRGVEKGLPPRRPPSLAGVPLGPSVRPGWEERRLVAALSLENSGPHRFPPWLVPPFLAFSPNPCAKRIR